MTQRPLPAALRWVPRWRAAARIARRDAGRHRGRTALVATLVALPLIAGAAGLVLLRSTEPSDAAIVRDTLGSTAQARITLECAGDYVPRPGRDGVLCTGSGEPVPRTAREMDAAFTRALPEGSAVVPVSIAPVDYVAGAESQPSRPYAEIDLAGLGTLAALDEGRVPAEPSEVLVSGHMARSALVDVGDRVVLRTATPGKPGSAPQVELTVVGIGRVGAGVPADFVGYPGTALDPFADALQPRTWYVTGDAPVLAEHAELLYPLGLEVLSRDLVLPPEARLAPSGGMVNLEVVTGNYISASAVVVTIVALLVLLEAVLLIGPAFVVGARRETRNLALVAATGGEPSDLRRIVLATGLVVGGGAAAGGTVVGAALGAALVPLLRTQDIYVPDVALPVLELVALTLAGTAVAVAAAWLPARQAARTDVVAALSGRRPVATDRRRAPVAGLVLLGAGITAVLVGTLTGWGLVLLLGVLALELGIIGTAGSVVGRLARAAHRTGPALRFALRDADRHRARTAPALAAIIAATAVVAAGLTYQASLEAHDQRLTPPQAAVGTLLVGLHPPLADGATEIDPAAVREHVASAPWAVSVAEYAANLVDALGDVAVVKVRSPIPPRSLLSGSIEPLRPAGEQCPQQEQDVDPRCGGDVWAWSPFMYASEDFAVLVDDGDVVRALDLPDAAKVAESLADEHAVVASGRDLWTEPDGSTAVHLRVPGEDGSVVVPAVAHPWGEWTYPLILPPGVVEKIGWTSATVGIVVPATADVSAIEESAIWRLPEVPGIEGWPGVVTEPPTGSSSRVVALIGAAALLSVLATWIVVGLAASESRPDLATISAVGASPRTRRALAGAQAGVLAVVGTGLGLAAGVLFGGVLVLSERVRDDGTGWAWHLDLPWALLTLLACTAPLLAISGAALATRSRLPLTRRLA